MANTKISQLPTWTGTAADLRWFVMNNSGNTETFKYSGYSSPYRYTNSTFSSNNTYDTNTLAGSYNHIIGGLNHSVQGNYNGVMAGYGHTFSNIYSSNIFVGGGLSHTFEGGDRTTSIGGYGNYFYGGEQNYGVGGLNNQIFIANNSGIIGGENCSVYTGFGTKHNSVYSGAYNKIITDAKDYNTILNGSGNTISGSSYYSTIINGSGNTISSANNINTILGGGNNTISGGINNTIIGGQGNTNTSTRGTILGGINNQHSGTNGVVLGGENNIANGWIASVGGYLNTASAEIGFVYGNQCIGQGQTIGIVGAEHGRTLGSTFRSFIGGGLYNWMTNATNSVMLGGMNNTITGGTNQVMLGTSGRTANADNTTYVENLHIYRTPSTQVQPIVSGTTFTANLELGAKSQFYITGTSTINITNVRDGASFMIKTQTDGNYVMTWTSPGYTFLFSDGGGNPGNNTIDIFVFEVFGSVIYGTRRHNFT